MKWLISGKWPGSGPLRQLRRRRTVEPDAEQQRDLAEAALSSTKAQLGDPVVNEARVRRQFWPKVKRVARRIPFIENVVAAYYCAIDPRTPVSVRATLFGGLAYFILPMDFIPDIVAGFGYTDDMAVISAMLSALGRHVRPRHHAAARAALGMEEGAERARA